MKYLFVKLHFFLILFSMLFFQNLARAEESKSFLSLTDIHFTPFVACHNVKPCPLIQTLKESSIDQWEDILAKYDIDKPQYGQDTTFPLLISSLKAAHHEAQAANVQFVLSLGDFLSHDYKKNYADYSGDSTQEGYQAFVKKTLGFLTLEFKKTFKTLDVYSLLGNNDSYVDDYVFDAKGSFFKDVGEMWSDLIKNPDNKKIMQEAFSKAGYYALTLPDDPKIRLIVLNSTIFSSKAQGDEVLQAAQYELEWLNQELNNVDKNHQKAILAMHIPLGMDVYATLKKGLPIELMQPELSESLLSIFTHHANQIMVVLTAHLHSDCFEILNYHTANEIANSMIPSISPINGNNPGFKVFNYADQITDYSTFILPLDKNGEWAKEYDFKDVYDPTCKTCSILVGMKNLSQTGTMADAYKLFYATLTDTQSITKGKWLPYYWCAIHTLATKEYKECIGTYSNLL